MAMAVLIQNENRGGTIVSPLLFCGRDSKSIVLLTIGQLTIEQLRSDLDSPAAKPRQCLLPGDFNLILDRLNALNFSKRFLGDLFLKERLHLALDRDMALVGLDMQLALVQVGTMNDRVEDFGRKQL